MRAAKLRVAPGQRNNILCASTIMASYCFETCISFLLMLYGCRLLGIQWESVNLSCNAEEFAFDSDLEIFRFYTFTILFTILYIP